MMLDNMASKAAWWHREGDQVKCDLCPHRCAIGPGRRGRCGARKNIGGELVSLTYGRVCVSTVDPIEKKPIFHYRPGTRVLSLGTFGCNLLCRFCQNAVLACATGDLPATDMEPREVVDLALKKGVQGIAWTFNEPIVWAEFIIETAEHARARGLYTLLNTNGFILPRAAEELLDIVDVANIDVKGFSERFYHDVCGGTLHDVLDTCTLACRKGVHLELTNLLVPSLNDSASEIKAFSRWVVGNLGPDTPIFFFRFHPAHELSDLPEQSMEKMEEARSIATEAGARYVYFGGIVGEVQDTRCPSCGLLVVERRSVRPTDRICLQDREVSRFCPTFADVKVNLEKPRCPRCEFGIAIDLDDTD
jgi:pyruvate formate lyase activating enzyme